MTQGMLLCAHGARDPRWALPFEAIGARIVQQRPGLPLELAYLEFIAPDLLVAGGRLADQGCTRVEVLPLFLGSGGHVRNDLHNLVTELSSRHPNVSWQLHPAVGELDSVQQAMADASVSLLGSGGT